MWKIIGRSGKRTGSRRRVGVAFTAVATLFAVAAYLAQRGLAEDCWWSALLLYVPQLVFLVPSTIGAVYCILRKRFWLAYFNLGVAVASVPLFMGPVWSRETTSAGAGFRVMTYNAQCGSQGVADVVATIRAQDPDVVCLQEAYNSNPSVDVESGVRRGLPGYTVIRKGDILTASRLPVAIVETWALPGNPDRRSALVAVVQAQGRKVAVINVHLIPGHADQMIAQPSRLAPHLAEVSRVRLRQIRELVRRVEAQKTPVILVGDFNNQPNGRAYTLLSDAMADCFVAAGRGFGYTIPSSMPLMRYDFAWLRGGLKTARAYVPPALASDHRPLVVDLRIP